MAYVPISAPTDPAVYNKQLHETTGGYLTAVNCTFLALAFIPWSLRIFSRVYILRNKGADDIFVTVAYASIIVLTVLQYDSGKHGLGRHYWVFNDMSMLENSVSMWRNNWIIESLYSLAALCSKISVLCFFLRVAPSGSGRKHFRKMVFATMAFVGLWSGIIFIIIMCVCRPVSANWNYKLWDTKCWSNNTVGLIVFAQAALNAISDLVVFFLPSKMVWTTLTKSRLSASGKIRFATLPSIGLLACLIGIGRLYALHLFFYGDTTYNLPTLYVTLTLELNLVVICVCLPFCKHSAQFLSGSKHVRDSVFPGSSRSPRRAVRSLGATDLETNRDFISPIIANFGPDTMQFKFDEKEKEKEGSDGMMSPVTPDSPRRPAFRCGFLKKAHKMDTLVEDVTLTMSFTGHEVVRTPESSYAGSHDRKVLI